MICDDNMFNLTTLHTMISLKFHIETVICSSGEQALDLIQSRINRNEQKGLISKPFQLVFMDCEMPQMSGFEVTKRTIKMCKDAGCG